MSYNVIIDRIETRNIRENNKPRYVVKGTAMIANKKHIHEYRKQPDGSFRTLKSMFTPNCLESIKKQAKSRKIFIDTQHELVRDASIKSIVKGKLSGDEQKQIDNMLKQKKLPLAKITDLEINDDRLDIETEFNSVFRDVDLDHKNYFDAVWSSLENKFLNGISINFGEFKYDTDEEGDTVIDDAEVLGFSFLDGAAEPDNGIYEVAIRAIEEGINVKEGVEMEEEKKKLEADKVKLEEDKKVFEAEKAATEKAKTDKAEADKKADIEKQATEQKKIEDNLAAKTEEAKKLAEEKEKLEGELNSAKGVVAQIHPSAQGDTSKFNEEFYKKNLKSITADHDSAIEKIGKGQQPMIDKRMTGFGELINLQAKNGPTVGLTTRQVEDIEESRLLERGEADLITNKTG